MNEHHLGFDPDMSSVDRKGIDGYHESLKREMKRKVETGEDLTQEGLELHKTIDGLEKDMREKQI